MKRIADSDEWASGLSVLSRQSTRRSDFSSSGTEPYVEIHPEPLKLQINDGEQVQVISRRGEVFKQ